jgi:hypothetical protein
LADEFTDRVRWNAFINKRQECRMRKMIRLAVLGLAAYGASQAYAQFKKSNLTGAPVTGGGTGRDTATGTDPNAKWSVPGFEDKSLGQAVNQDADLVDRLVEETGGDLDAAEARLNEESAGAPALHRQRRD